MIQRVHANGLPFEAICCDDFYGKSSDFRAEMRAAGFVYMADAPHNTRVYLKRLAWLKVSDTSWSAWAIYEFPPYIIHSQWMDPHELKILLSCMPRSKGIFPDYNHVISQCQENISKYILYNVK